MDKEYTYTNDDYEMLEDALEQSDLIRNGRPDQFQYFQNQLSKQIACFLLKPYRDRKERRDDEKPS